MKSATLYHRHCPRIIHSAGHATTIPAKNTREGCQEISENNSRKGIENALLH
jgi:hypothetical protein